MWSRLRRRSEQNPNDLWEAFPTMRFRAYVELYPPDDPQTGERRPEPMHAVLAPLIRRSGVPYPEWWEVADAAADR
jgi:hypothetical protein